MKKLMENKEFEFKIITRDSDEKHYQQLLENAAFIYKREQDTTEWLKWKYFGSPFGDCIVIAAYTKDGILAGEVSFGRYEFILEGKLVKAIYTYQQMVHPNFQRKGLFGALTKRMIDIAKKENIDVMLVFPNKASFSPLIKLGFKQINHIKNKVAFTKPLHIVFKLKSFKQPFYANIVSSINEKALLQLEQLKEHIKPLKINNVLTPNRTFEFLKWRFFTHPLYEYQLVDTKSCFAIVRKGKRGSLSEVQVMEFFSKHDKFEKIDVKLIKKQIKKELSPDILIWNLSESHPLFNILNKCSFFSLPHNINFVFLPINAEFNKFDTYESWIVTATEFHRY